MVRRCLVVHLIVLRDEGLLVLVIFSRVLGFEAGLGERLGGGIVDTNTARAAATSVNDCTSIELGVVVLLHASNASKRRDSQSNTSF